MEKKRRTKRETYSFQLFLGGRIVAVVHRWVSYVCFFFQERTFDTRVSVSPKVI